MLLLHYLFFKTYLFGNFSQNIISQMASHPVCQMIEMIPYQDVHYKENEKFTNCNYRVIRWIGH